MIPKHEVFISYHHKNDQRFKKQLIQFNQSANIFNDISVNTGDIDDSLASQRIREIIRDDYLRDSSVTILLAGRETKKRKHIDWELYSSMINGKVNKKSGILVITLPTTNCTHYTASHNEEKEKIYPQENSWTTVDTRKEYERRYPFMPDRIIDNLLNDEARISVTNWNKIINNGEALRFLIHKTSEYRLNCEYDLHRPMKRANS